MSSTSLAVRPTKTARLAARAGGWPRRRFTLLAGAATLMLAWTGLVVLHTEPRLPAPKELAIQRALADPTAARLLAATGWRRADVTPIDAHHEMVGFYRGASMVATVDLRVNQGIAVTDATNLSRQSYAYGSNIANYSAVLAALSVVFILMTGVWPLWRLRNLDVLVATSSALTIVLFNRWMLTRMVLVSYPALIYLALRCAWWGLGSRRTPPPAVPLYNHLTRAWPAEQRRRLLRAVAGAAALVIVMVGLTSLSVLDVGYAVMEGATAIVHGVLPYGHIPGVLHGDTYPIGSYLLYVPLAWLSPVHSSWDDPELTLVVAVVGAIVGAAAIARIASRASRPHRGLRAPDDAGLRAAIAWMTFPPLLVTVSTGTTDVALAAILAGALALWRRPAWATAVVSGAAWFKFAPVTLLPLLLSRLRGLVLWRALAAIVLVSAVMLAGVVALGGVGAPAQMLDAMSFQFTRASPHTLWAVVGSVPLQQLAQAGTIALIVAAVLSIRRDPTLAADRARFAAIAASILLGLQICANYWNYMYIVWVLPFLAVSIFGDPVQPQINPSTHRAQQPM